jgi:hypothetical protein
MYARLPKYVPAFLVSALLVTACGDNDGVSPTAPSQPALQMAAFTAEPDTVLPQFFLSPFCPQFNPFGVTFVVIVRPDDDVFLRGMRVNFLDRFGRNAIPHVVPFHGTSPALPINAGPVTIPTSPTIPTPVSSTIPIPGASGFDPLLIQRGTSRTIPFFLQFACGVPADGTVFVDFDLTDRRGRSSTSQVRVRLRS